MEAWTIDIVYEERKPEVKLPFWQFLLGTLFCLAVGMTAGSILATL